MVNRVSFEGIGEVIATFLAEEKVVSGQVVKLTANGKVDACAAGERFIGQAVSDVRGGCVAVQLAGFLEAKNADVTELGHVSLTADGTGGIKKATVSDKGQECLVVSAGNGRIMFMM